MSDTKWRISGGLGVPDQPAQVMTQGLGFPLRPVDNVPSTGADFGDFIVAEGIFLQWMGPHQPGLLYPTGSVVTAAGWTMIANTPNVTYPAPVPEGNPTWALPTTPAFVEQQDESVIYSGHVYTFTENGWARGLRVWVPELTVDTNYRIVVIDITDPNKPILLGREEPVLAEDEWTVVSLANTLVLAGQKFLVYLDALNSGGDTAVNGGWTYNGSSGNAPVPALGGWTKDNQNQTLRIDKTDLDSTDRTSELAGFIPGTDIQFSQTNDTNRSMSFTTMGAVVDGGTYFEYGATLISTGPSGIPEMGETTTMTASVPVAQSTKYVQVPGTPTPSWATVEPVLEYDGIDQSPGDVAFGVDLEFDIAVINTAWDVMATTEL